MANNMTRAFVTENFEYLSQLKQASVDLSTNRYLLEHIANGFARYGTSVDAFVKNADKWLRMLAKIYPEIGFNHEKCQVMATIDLADQLVVIDNALIDKLRYIINVQSKCGLLITYDVKGAPVTNTIARFFEYIESQYPVEEDRYKGLGSSDARVSKEIIMDPKTRRIIRVTMDDATSLTQIGILIGKSKEQMAQRKELMWNFDGKIEMIDN